MKLKIPSLDDISSRLRQHYDSELEGTQSHIWPNNLYVTSKVIAKIIWELFVRLRFIADQAYVLTTAPEYLDRHAAEYGMSRLPAGRATGNIAISNATPSAHIPESAKFKRGDGTVFECLTATTLSGLGAGSVPVRAIEEGTVANTSPSTPLQSQNVVLGVNAKIIADIAGLTGGAGVESDENYRRRIWFRKKYAPHAGSPSDYVRWSFEISGVSRVWIRRAFPRHGAVTVVIMMDETYEDGLPLGGDITRLRDYLEAVAPAGSEIFVTPPKLRVIDVVASSVYPLTPATREAIEAELVETFKQRSDMGKDFSRSWISQAVSNATGEDKHVLESPSGDITVAIDELPVLGTVTLT